MKKKEEKIKINAEKLDKIVHHIVNLQQKLKIIEMELMEIRNEILFSINNNDKDKEKEK